MEKTIQITCEGADLIPYTDLLEFQDDLKDLTKDNYEALKQSILAEGFCEPVTIWKGHKEMGNGHQRLRVVKQMVEKEGYLLKDNLIPVGYTIAKDKREFARKVLAMAGNYGTTNKQGLYEYMDKWDISVEELSATFRLAGVDNMKFIEEFHAEGMDEDDLALEPKNINEDEPLPEDTPTSQVRMVQLFFDVETANRFTEMIEELKDYYGTTNVTDTVLGTVKESYDAHNSSERAKI